jgi:hypothetical protein
VGGEWAYANITNPIAGQVISSSGFGLVGAGNFLGPNLDSPASVDGNNFSILPLGDNFATGNTGLRNDPQIWYYVILTLSGIPGGFDPSTAISNVSFQYGTSLTEPRLPGTPWQPPPPVSEPASLVLLGGGLGLLAKRLRSRRES